MPTFNLHIDKFLSGIHIGYIEKSNLLAEEKKMNQNISFDVSDDCNKNSDFDPSHEHNPPELLSDSEIINTLMSTSDDMIYFKDLDSKYFLNNKAHALRLGMSDPRDLIGKCDADFYPEEAANRLRQDELEIIKSGIPIVNKMELSMNASNNLLCMSSSKYPLFNRDGKTIGTWGISRDMTKLVRAEEELAIVNTKLKSLSLTDELTGLYNHRHFYDSLEIAISIFARKRSGGFTADFCLVILDVDLFKIINDSFGHVIGDAAIRYIAGLIMAHTRSSDTSFRYGGDEYAIILQDTSLSAGRDFAERLRMIIEQNPLQIDDKTIALTISVGVVCYDNEETAQLLVQKADARLYQSKQDGRNRVT